MKHPFLLSAFFVIAFAEAQTPQGQQRDSVPPEYYIIEGDTVLADAVHLDEIFLFNKLKFKDDTERRRYLILRRKTRKVYPYARLAAQRLTQLNARLDSMDRKGDKRKYMRIIQRYVEDEFGPQLKKLSRTEGQILVKLINRQTGITTFDLIKEYRNGWKAFWLNTTAGLFDIDLKKEFDPANEEEDYLIEDILQRSFQEGVLERQRPAKEYTYTELYNKWRAVRAMREMKYEKRGANQEEK